MVYHILREEILLIALNYLLSFCARKNAEQLVKYPRVLHLKHRKMWMYAYDETRYLIEIRDRGVKITTLLLDHNLSNEDNTCYGKLLSSTSTLARLCIYNVCFLTDAIIWTISVGTVSIRIIYMPIIIAFINISEHNLFSKGNWIENKKSKPIC